MKDEIHGTIYKSKDYAKFKFADFNRQVNKSNLKKLISAGAKKPKFHLFPIIVDDNYCIIDGQHRFKACQFLDLPVFYIFDKDEVAEPELIYSLNTAGKKHTTEERLVMLSKAGNEAAGFLVNLQKRFPKFRLVSVLEVSYGGLKASRAIERVLDENMPDKEDLKTLGQLNRLSFKAYSNRLCRAFTRLSKTNRQGSKHLTDRIIKNERMVFDGGCEADVYKSLVRAYNHGLRESNKIKIAG